MLLIATAFIILALPTPRTVYGMEKSLEDEEQKTPLGVQPQNQGISNETPPPYDYPQGFVLQNDISLQSLHERLQRVEQEAVKAWRREEAKKKIEDLEKQLAVFQKREDEYRQKLEQEVAIRRAEEAEKQSAKEFQEAALRDKQEICAMRESRIDKCIDYCLQIAERGLTMRQLAPILHHVEMTYNVRHSSPMKVQGQYHDYEDEVLLHVIALRQECEKSEAYSEDAKRRGMRIEMRYARGCSTLKNLVELERLIKKDLIESMLLYEEVHGVLHPRWEDVKRIVKHEVDWMFLGSPILRGIIKLHK